LIGIKMFMAAKYHVKQISPLFGIPHATTLQIIFESLPGRSRHFDRSESN
jgi:hypothetical protein